ncbi:MAG TPA: hypothetical protein VGO08_23020 [Burkholderiales bacterium]|nr:hypothetical protein [Burkholderiales bacterium]
MPRLEQWRQMWLGLGVPVPDDGLLQDLIGRYCEPHRKYHTTQHLDECFDRLQALRSTAAHPHEIELALWFHDAIYDVKRRDNEEKSADWARSTVSAAGLAAEIGQRVHALVMATRHNAVSRDVDEQILVDVDLSILGASPERFDEYEQQVREEYSWVPDVLFRHKRRSVLTEFLERPTIFNTAGFINRYEAQARANLERSIKRLVG